MKYNKLELISEGMTPSNVHFLESYRFNDDLGFPNSYVNFVKQLGWGRLCKLFLVYIPLQDANYPDSWQIQTKRIKGFMDEFYLNNKDDEYLFEPDGSLSLIKSAIPFARSENGEYLIWDTRSRVNGEFPIFLINSRFSGIRFAGCDLYEFIHNCTHLPHVKKILGSGYEPLSATFESLKPHINTYS